MRIDIKEKKECCGCTSCLNSCPQNCISMMRDEEGFSYPLIEEEKCVDCGMCVRVCPIKNTWNNVKNVPNAYAAINLNEDMRLKSSSGGIFVLFSEKILAKNGKVYGVAFNSDDKVQHVGIESSGDLWKILGSKYLQSDMNSIYKDVREDLNSGRTVLFSGTPCQCAGLKSYLNKNYDNLFLIDFICHGVPSPSVWEKYLKALELKVGNKRNKDIMPSFRDKTEGWTHFSVKIPFNNFIYHRKFGKDLYMRVFLKNIILRPSCYHCSFKPSNNITDITLGDFWGVKKCLPKMFDDKGTSVILVNSIKGERLLKDIINEIRYEKVEYDTIVNHNSSICKSAKEPDTRKPFFDNFNKKDILYLMKKYTKESLIKRCLNAVRGYVKQ